MAMAGQVSEIIEVVQLALLSHGMPPKADTAARPPNMNDFGPIFSQSQSQSRHLKILDSLAGTLIREA